MVGGKISLPGIQTTLQPWCKKPKSPSSMVLAEYQNQGNLAVSVRHALCYADFHNDDSMRCDESFFPLLKVYKVLLSCGSCYVESDMRALSTL